MEVPKNYIENLRQCTRPLKITNERQELIQRFVDKINLERVGTKFKPATARQINTLISFLHIRDLYWLCSVCEQSSSFSKKFFGVLRDTKISKK